MQHRAESIEHRDKKHIEIRATEVAPTHERKLRCSFVYAKLNKILNTQDIIHSRHFRQFSHFVLTLLIY